MATPATPKIWDEAKELIKGRLSSQSFETWFDPIKLSGASEMEIVLEVPNKFFKNWVSDKYLRLIEDALLICTNKKMSVVFYVPQTSLPAEPVASPRQAEAVVPTKHVGLNMNYTFDDFVVGPSNRFAHAASLAVSETPAKAYNPLFIYGGVGLGKTHLMHSIGNKAAALNKDLKVLYISSEQFTNQLIGAIRNRTTVRFRQLYRSVDILLIDDIQFIGGKEATQ
ncbi:MAG: DnaA/Hda family protein, partial [Candidatus Omnitrophota bacterium]